MYVSILSNPASALATSTEVYSYFLYDRCRRSRPVNSCATWSWKPPRTRPMQGVTTHVSAPNISTDLTTALNKKLDTCGLDPSLIRILVILLHTDLSFVILWTTAGQLSSAAKITLHRYLKEVTISRGIP